MRNKAANKDFTISNLPYNRRQQFSDVLKHRFNVLIKCGLMLLLFVLPILICIFFKDISTLNLMNSGEENQDLIFSIMFTTDTIYRLIMMPCLFVFSIGLSGVIRVLRNLIFSEPIFFKDDFKDGIKNSIKPMLVISILIGLVSLLGGVLNNLISIGYLSVIPQAFNYLVIYPVCFIAFFLTSIYKNSFSINVRTSFAIYIKLLPKILLSYGLFVIIVLCQFVPVFIFIIKYLLIILLIVFYMPISLFGSYLYQVSLYDKYINYDQFPNYYLKGLYHAKNENKE